MLEAVYTNLVFTISLKRSTQILQLSTSSPADYPIFPLKATESLPLPRTTFRARSGSRPYEANGSNNALVWPSDDLADTELVTFVWTLA
jgi:hypothetical protein